MNIGVTFTAHNRPQYLRETLASWAVAEGAHAVPFYFSCEPGQPDVEKQCRDFPYVQRVWVNHDNKGPLGNPWYALDRAFKRGHDFVILAEDDAVVSPDILDYFEAMAYRFSHRQDIFTICSFNHRQNGREDEFHRRTWFASTVWGITRERWSRDVKHHWGFTYAQTEWDKRFVTWLPAHGWQCIYPCVSRSQHIGRVGAHMREEDFEALQGDSFYTGPKIKEWKEKILVQG